MDSDLERPMAPSDTPTEVEPNTLGSPEQKDIADPLNWDVEPSNPINWSVGRKVLLIAAMSASALHSTIATSIITPAHEDFMEEFNVDSTVAVLPLTLFVLALGFGPVIGGPLSETVGRYPVYMSTIFLGSLFTIGGGFTNSFAALCVLRFLAGFAWGPALAVAGGSLSDTFLPKSRGPPTAIFILMPFLGPGLGPVLGSFAVSRKGWRWTQWILLFFSAVSLVLMLFSGETFHPVLKKRLAKKRGVPEPPQIPLSAKLRLFLQVALIRPVLMLFTEPIVAFICLYVAFDFGTLFSFFGGVPYTFGTVYHFSLEHSGLVFLSIIIGCLLSFLTVIACEILLYRKQIPKHHPHQVPPEYRLYPAMVGSIGLPVGLFWFAWSARPGISWASPAAAIIPFSWGNLCVFISTIQYITDTYDAWVVASALSANSLARYGFAGVFPLFTIQMYEKLGIDWASSLLGFIAIALMPIPWVLFRYGPRVRARSKFGAIGSDEK